MTHQRREEYITHCSEGHPMYYDEKTKVLFCPECKEWEYKGFEEGPMEEIR